MTELQRFDVLIVGAGMVGQALAAKLASSNSQVNIALVDPNPAAKPPASEASLQIDEYDLRVSALTDQSRCLLLDAGAWNRIPASRLSPYLDMKVWDAEGTGSVHFNADDLHAENLGHIVENRETLWALDQANQGLPNVHRITSAVRSFDNPDSEGLIRVILDDQSEVETSLLVGADGAHSRIRQLAGLSTREWNYQHQAIVATVKTAQPMAQTAWQRFREEGPLALLPLAGDANLASIVWSTHEAEAEQLMTLESDEFCQALASAFEYQLGDILETSRRQVFPLRQRHAKRYWIDGVVLLGDAAHTIHPLAGQGVNLGFKDVVALAEELLEAFDRGVSPGHDQVLARYQRRRQSDNLATMAAMEGFKRLFGSRLPALRLLRNEGMRQFDKLLPVKQHAMMQAMGLS
ncbi:MAG: UbiH/UbiF/VisC/COQ6 family ubiquinone biosynthesis hydroxylase [Oceanobacter sp.]